MKRVLDVIISICAIAVLMVPLVTITLAIKITSPGPALYWSKRMGRNGQAFDMPKFRTMVIDAPLLPTAELPNPDLLITKVGRVLRKTSLDELPQLFSVLTGKMSLVGPRPVLTSQTELLSNRFSEGVHVLRPGITGWAQINGRDNLSEDEKVRLDKEYLTRQSLWFDIQIMWRTIFYVLNSRGVWH